MFLLLMLLSGPITGACASDPTVWGAATYDVRCGFWWRSTSDGKSVEIIPEIRYGDAYNARRDRILVFLAPDGSRYKMALFDQDGRPVQKTEAGQALGVPTVPHKYEVNMEHGYNDYGLVRGIRRVTVNQDKMLLQDYFRITNSGKYRLELQVGLVWGIPLMKTNAVFQFLFLPPAVGDVDIKVK
jgi:hypothetical protein